MFSPEYLGLASVLKLDMIERWEIPNIQCFPQIWIFAVDFKSANPESLVFSTIGSRNKEF